MHNFILQFHPSNVDKAIDIIFPRRVRRENACKNNIMCKLWQIYITKWNSLVHINYHELILLFAIIKS